MKIVLISGKMGSGKTTLATALQEKWVETYHAQATCVNFADALYQMHNFCRDFLLRAKIEIEQPKDRKLLQWLGTEWGRAIDPDIWVKILKAHIENDFDFSVEVDGANPFTCLYIVADCRFENEITAFPSALKVRLECSRDVRKARCSKWTETDGHPSEIGLDTFKDWDLILDTGTTSVEECAQIVLEKLKVKL